MFKPQKKKVSQGIIEMELQKDLGEKKNPTYKVEFTHKGIRHVVGTFKDLKVAKMARDTKRVALGLQPIDLKKTGANLKNNNMKSQTIVFNTAKEYKKFLETVQVMPTAFNRKIKDSHVKDMVNSIGSIGIQRGINIINTKAFTGKSTNYTADGQHLSRGILNTPDEQLKGHFVVMINTIDSVNKIIPFVSLMNSTAKNWSLDDYLNAWDTHGLGDYTFIKTMRITTGHSLPGLIEAYSAKRVINNNRDDFQNGVYKIDRVNGNAILELYKKALVMGLRESNSSFLAMVRFRVNKPNLDEVKFLKGIKKERHFKESFNRDAFIALFRNIPV